MNKKLLTIAVGTALSAGVMITAQADTVLYGHFHMSLDRLDNDVVKDSRISNNASRIGVKGNQDLGGGMKAIYQLETGVVALDEGTGGLGGTLRNSFIGLSGPWGTVKVGKHDTPTKDLGRKLDRFNEEIGDARNIYGAGGAFDPRPSNMVRYESPKIAGGLTFNALHAGNNGAEQPLPNTAEKVTSANVIWDQGPIFAGLAYAVNGNATGTEDSTSIRAAGRFDFGMGDVGGLYERMSDLSGVSGRDQDVYGVFGSIKVGSVSRVKAQYFKAKDIDGTAAVDGGKLMAVGFDHNLGKTTRVYVSYAKIKNDSGATYNITSSNGGHGEVLPVSAGRDSSAISTGMVIDF